MTTDPRLTPARGDIAALHLKGSVEAERFVEGALREVVLAGAPLYERPDARSRRESELLTGERFTLYDARDGFAWGQAQSDSYVGYIEAHALAAPAGTATHRVAALRSILFTAPDVKSPVAGFLAFGARLAIEEDLGRFARTARGAFAISQHLSPLAARESDFVAAAERFFGAPYLWGGKTANGIDCSGLVQIALDAAGIPAPRDSDLQEQALGAPVEITPALAGLHRGDLIFWDGHVGLMRDAETLLHANAHHMQVAIEPLHVAAARIAPDAGRIASIKRL